MVIRRGHRASPAAPLVLVLLAAAGCTSASDAPAEPAGAPATSGAPAGSVARVCAEPAAGPAKAPPGAVTVDPAVVGDLAAKTRSSPIATAPLYADCRWKTQRVDIPGNRFVLDTSVVTCAAECGRMAVLANYGTYPDWSPYRGKRVAEAITHKQHNRWHDNVYRGPWSFVAGDPGHTLEPGQWQGASYQQDAGSTFTPQAGG